MSATASADRRGSPYLGLRPFEAEDASFFFGRREEAELLAANLRTSRTSLVYGESGVGKSSLLRAGLGPILDQRSLLGECGDQARKRFSAVIYAVSREDPTSALSRRIAEATGVEACENSVLKTIERAANEVERILIVLDQFEEYLGHADGADNDRFAVDLVRAMTRSELPVHFMIAIREDSISKLDRFRPRTQELMSNPIRIEPLSVAAAREVIDGPIRAYNELRSTDYWVQEGFADTVIEATGAGMLDLGVGGRGGIEQQQRAIEAAYLQLVLRSVWDAELRSGSNEMTVETFERLGGVVGIVRKHVDDIMDKFSRDEQLIAAAAFRFLVTPSGMKVPYSSWDLSEMTHNRAYRMNKVLGNLAGEDARLVRPLRPSPMGHQRYEIYHDRLADPILDWRLRFERSADRAGLLRSMSFAMSGLFLSLSVVVAAASVSRGLVIYGAVTAAVYALVGVAPSKAREHLMRQARWLRILARR